MSRRQSRKKLYQRAVNSERIGVQKFAAQGDLEGCLVNDVQIAV